MSIVGEAQVRISPDARTFGRETEQQVRGGLAAVAKQGAAILAGAFAVEKVASIFAGAITSASSLAEEQNKAKVVFKDSADEVIHFADEGARAFNLSRLEATRFTADFGNLLTALGLGEEQAAEMSVTLVKLAGDLESFTNIPASEALLALRSGLSGETEPLKRFGIVLNEARLQQAAFEQGLTSSVKQGLTPAQKAAAAYSLILKDTANAQGDAARTSDTFAAQGRKLVVSLKDFQLQVGQVLLPVATSAVTGLRAIADVMGLIPQPALEAGIKIIALTATARGLAAATNFLLPRLGAMIISEQRLTSAVAGNTIALTAQQSRLRTMLSNVFNPTTIAIAGIVLAYETWRSAQERQKRITEDLEGILEDQRASLSGTHRAVLEYAESNGLIVSRAKEAGISLETLTALIEGDDEAIRNLTRSQRDAITSNGGLLIEIGRLSRGYDEATSNAEEHREITDEIIEFTRTNTDVQSRLKDELDAVQRAYERTARSADTFQDVLDATLNPALKVAQSNVDVAKQVAKVKEAFEDAKTPIVDQKDAILDYISAAIDLVDAQTRAGKVSGSTDAQLAALNKTFLALKRAVPGAAPLLDQLTRSLDKVPTQKKVDLQVKSDISKVTETELRHFARILEGKRPDARTKGRQLGGAASSGLEEGLQPGRAAATSFADHVVAELARARAAITATENLPSAPPAPPERAAPGPRGAPGPPPLGGSQAHDHEIVMDGARVGRAISRRQRAGTSG